jgi:hypothetical protein
MISSKIFINMSDDKPIKFSDKAIMGSDTDYSNYFSMMYHLRNQAKTNGVHSYLMGDVILDTMQSLIDSKPKERDFLKHAHVTQSDEDEKHYRKELNAKCIQDPLYPNQLLICADPKKIPLARGQDLADEVIFNACQAVPILDPSSMPSSQPLGHPTRQPTVEPSSQLSRNPSSQP